jgi:hypothetical protein
VLARGGGRGCLCALENVSKDSVRMSRPMMWSVDGGSGTEVLLLVTTESSRQMREGQRQSRWKTGGGSDLDVGVIVWRWRCLKVPSVDVGNIPHGGRGGIMQRGPGRDLPAKHLLRHGGGLMCGVWMVGCTSPPA